MGLQFLKLSEKTLQASDKVAVRKILVYMGVKSYWGIRDIR
jgi:hypothetical protein